MNQYASGDPSRGSGTGSGPWVLAIDFGTTYTTAAIDSGARSDIVDFDGSPRVPSVVLLSDEGGFVVGQIAERQIALAPERAEQTPKRRIGDELILLGGRTVAPVDLVAAVLRSVHDEAVRQRGGWSPAEVVLTHPVRWADHRLSALASAARRAGISKPRLVPEPVAAAMFVAEALVPEAGYLAVYDLGGGTLDTAVLQRTAAGFQVVGLPGGDDRFGGENLDEMLYTHLGRRIAADAPDAWESLRFSSERPWRKANHDLRTEVRRAKEALSTTADYGIYVGAPLDRELQVTRSEFESLIHAALVTSVDEFEGTIARAGIAPGDLSAIALVGGSSRIPLVSRLVSDRFGRVPETWGDPKSVVALGALRAAHLAIEAPVSVDPTPLEVTPFGGRDDDMPSEPLPAHVGDYEVIAELGRGGMGVVYLAKQPSLHRLVAVKTLPSLGRSFADRLQREAAVLVELQHPHLATVLDVGLDGGSTYVVMLWFPGGSLAHVLRQQGALRPGQAAGVLAALAEALDATHRKGFLHRDLKPSNVLLSETGDPYLADFGLAMSLDTSVRTTSRQLLGTAGYTAPEVIADDDPSPASDVFSLGVCGYQLLTGRMPFGGRNLLAIVDAVRSNRRAPLADLAPDAPAALVALIEEMLASDAADRPRDLRRLANQLRMSTEIESVQPAPPAAWAAAAAAAAIAMDGGVVESAAAIVDVDPEAVVGEAAPDDAGAGPGSVDEVEEVESGAVVAASVAGAAVGRDALNQDRVEAPVPTDIDLRADEHSPAGADDAPVFVGASDATVSGSASAAPIADNTIPIVPIRPSGGDSFHFEESTAPAEPARPTDADVARMEEQTDHKRTRRPLLLVGASAALVVLVVALIAFLGGGDKGGQPSVAPRKSATFELAAEASAKALTVDRSWKLSGTGGGHFESRMTIENTTAAPVSDNLTEVIPKAVAKKADELHVDPGTATMTVVEADPVLQFAVTLDPGAKTTIVITAEVARDGATKARLARLAADRQTALTDFQTRTGALVTATSTSTPVSQSIVPDAGATGAQKNGSAERPAGPSATTPRTSPPVAAPATPAPTPPPTPPPNHAPVLNIVPYVVDMADDQVPSWDRFWLGSDDVTDPDGDPWQYASYSSSSGAEMYVGACGESSHGCLFFHDSGSCGRATIYVTVKDNKGAVSNQDYFYADYC